jgi:Ni,Fe-hydrogenase maturation factor
MGFLKKETAARIYLIGIQPKTVRLGDSVSPEVEKSMDEILMLIKKGLGGVCTKHI